MGNKLAVAKCQDYRGRMGEYDYKSTKEISVMMK